jgi:hypothetical protein
MASWWVLYDLGTGQYWGDTSDQTKLLTAEQLVNRAQGIAGPFTDAQHAGVWNRQTLSYDPAPARPVLVDPDDFLDQLSPAELDKWSKSASPAAKKFFLIITTRSRPINLLGARVQRILNGMTAAGYWDDQNNVGGAATTRPAAVLAYRPTADT